MIKLPRFVISVFDALRRDMITVEHYIDQGWVEGKA